MAANKQTQAEVVKDEVIKNKAQQTHESEELSDEDLESVAGGDRRVRRARNRLIYNRNMQPLFS
jgi:hypothetical protein